jgi:type II secretion system protein L
MARAIRLGYRESALRAARRLGKPVEEIEAGLRDGTLAADAVLAGVVQEVETTLRSAEKTSRVRPSRVVVSGAPAAWPGVLDALGQALHMPASALRWGETELGDYATLAGAIVESSKAGGGIDLRTGEFAYTRAIELVKGKLALTGAFAAVLLLLVIGGNVATWVVKSRQATRLQDDIEAVFLAAMPNEPIVDPLQQVQAQVRTMRGQVEGGSSQGVVDILKGMSQAVEGGVVFKMNEFHRDAAGVRIKGETDSYEHIELIKTAVAGLPGLKCIKVTDSKSTATGTVVFELSMEGACT